MAIFEKTIRNKNFDKLLRKLENEIPDSSWSADLELSLIHISMCIRDRRCTVQQASVAELPFEAEQFDVVTAFETVYFWPELAQNFREIYREMCIRDRGKENAPGWSLEALEYIYKVRNAAANGHETLDTDSRCV